MENNKTTAKDFFFQLSAIVLLYVSFGALLSLLFDLINYLLPDNLTNSYYYYDPYSTSVRWSISLLLVLFPVFLFITRYNNKVLRENIEKRDIWVRKWLTYLTVFISAAIVCGDLITLLNTFLNGEVTERFVYKVLAVLSVSLVTFLYYLYDLRGKITESPKLGKIFGILGAVLVFGSIIWGFVLIGSPQKARDIRFDQAKVTNLQTLQSSIISFWQTKKRLPNDLKELSDPLAYYKPTTVDPQTGKQYVYKVTGSNSFQLCATFNRDVVSRIYPYPNGGGIGGNYAVPTDGYDEFNPSNWQYKAGDYCFSRTIDPQRYPFLGEKGVTVDPKAID